MTDVPQATPLSDPGAKPAGRLEPWCFRLLLAAVFGVAFSIVLGQVFLAAALLLFLVSLCRSRLRVSMPRILWMVLIFAAVALLATVTGPNTKKGLESLPKLLWYLAIPMCAMLVSSSEKLRRILIAFALGAVVLSLKIFVLRSIEACGEPLRQTEGFVAALIHLGSMTDGQMLMLAIVAATGLLFVAHKEKRRTLLWLLVLGVLCAAEVANFKRGSWFVTIGMLGLFVVLQTNWRYLLVLVVAVLIVGMLPPVQKRMLKLRTEFNVAGGGRMTMWVRLTPGLIKKHPLGIGYGAMTEQMMQDEARAQDITVETNRNHLHSNLAQVLVETGWAGLGVYLLWMGWALYATARFALSARGSPVRDQVPALLPCLMLIGLLANGLIEYNFGDTELLIVYSVIMGLAASRERALRRHEDQTELVQKQVPA